jgi:hypothetical protein
MAAELGKADRNPAGTFAYTWGARSQSCEDLRLHLGSCQRPPDVTAPRAAKVTAGRAATVTAVGAAKVTTA